MTQSLVLALLYAVLSLIMCSTEKDVEVFNVTRSP